MQAYTHTHTAVAHTFTHQPSLSLSQKDLQPIWSHGGKFAIQIFPMPFDFFSFSSSFAIWARSLHTPKANSLLYIYVFFLNVGYRDRMGRKVGRESWREFCFNPVDTKNHSRGFDFAGGNFPSISSSLVRLWRMVMDVGVTNQISERKSRNTK